MEPQSFFLRGELECSYCGEPFAYDRYTIEAPNNQRVASCCTKECRMSYNRWILGDSLWKEREHEFRQQDGRQVLYAPPPTIVKDRRKTCRDLWLPKTRIPLNEKDKQMAHKEMLIEYRGAVEQRHHFAKHK